MVRRGGARPGRVRSGAAGHGKARRGSAWQGGARNGWVWLGMARRGVVGRGVVRHGSFRPSEVMMPRSTVLVEASKSNGAGPAIQTMEPYVVHMTLEGTSDLLFHRWNCESVDEKSKASKNSKAKKTDDIESYVWRDEKKRICIPGEYVRQSMIHAAKFKQDPRSPRKSAMDLFKAGIVSLTILSSTGKETWDYLDTRRVTIQRNGINRVRPALRAGWKAEFDFQVLTPEYIDHFLFQEVLSVSGRLVGLGDFRPTYGRFSVVKFDME